MNVIYQYYYFFVVALPRQATNVTVKTMTAVSCELTWTPGEDGGYDQSFSISYKKKGDSDYNNTDKLTKDSMKIEGLHKESEYSMKVVAHNEYGSTESEEVVCTTRSKCQIVYGHYHK